MAAEGDNPSPQVQRLQEAVPRCAYNVDFYASLRPRCHQQDYRCLPLHARQHNQHRRLPPRLLPPSRPWLSNRDLRWQYHQVRKLLLEERQRLLHDSALMGPNSLLAGYSYEWLASPRVACEPQNAAAAAVFPQADACVAAGESSASAEADACEPDSEAASQGSEPPLSASPANWSTASTQSSKLNGASSSFNKIADFPFNQSKAANSSSPMTNACMQTEGSLCRAKELVDQRRARLFKRREPLTAQEVFAAVRCITDPEHPYTLEQLMVVLWKREQRGLAQQQLQLPAAAAATAAAAAAAAAAGVAALGSDARCTSGNYLPPHNPPLLSGKATQKQDDRGFFATLIGLLLLVKAQRAAAAVVAAETAAVDVSIIPGAHASYLSINKQLRDKERVRAAAANPSLKQMIDNGKQTPSFSILITDNSWVEKHRRMGLGRGALVELGISFSLPDRQTEGKQRQQRISPFARLLHKDRRREKKETDEVRLLSASWRSPTDSSFSNSGVF
ncbi:hypothetical protein Efla_003675 [Eimeria flavescens]